MVHGSHGLEHFPLGVTGSEESEDNRLRAEDLAELLCRRNFRDRRLAHEISELHQSFLGPLTLVRTVLPTTTEQKSREAPDLKTALEAWILGAINHGERDSADHRLSSLVELWLEPPAVTAPRGVEHEEDPIWVGCDSLIEVVLGQLQDER